MANSAAARVAAKPAFPPKEREGGREGKRGEGGEGGREGGEGGREGGREGREGREGGEGGRERTHEHVRKGETVSMTT